MVHRRIDYEQPFAISANIVNSPVTAWMHYRLGAIHPYLPEPAPVRRAPGNPQTWRASELPAHPDDADYMNLQFGRTPIQSIVNSAITDDDMLQRLFQDVPYSGHRWLPLTQNTTSLLYTPISRISTDPWGVGVRNWAVAAQQHYSLLQNIEEDAMHKYWMAAVPPLGEGVFNLQYSRYNLNFIAVWGKDVVEGAKVRQEVIVESNGDEKTKIVSEMDDDEKNLTADMPRSLGRPMLIDVQAVVAHMHFHDQEPYMQMTDVLDRWRAYVNDQVCAPNRQKKAPGQLDGLGYTNLNKGNGRWQCPWVTVEYNSSLHDAERNNPNN
nr:hypothetical protein CFP56_52746 [Quercus suber]